MTRSEILRERALALYEEARAIYAEGIHNGYVARRYLAKYEEAHKVDMAHLDARLEEMRAEAAAKEAA